MSEHKFVLPERMPWTMSGKCQFCNKETDDMEGDGWITSDISGFWCAECEEIRNEAYKIVSGWEQSRKACGFTGLDVADEVIRRKPDCHLSELRIVKFVRGFYGRDW